MSNLLRSANGYERKVRFTEVKTLIACLNGICHTTPRHNFGVKSSPTCAKFVVQHTARDNVKSIPVVSRAVFTFFQVDDFLQSVPCESDAVALASQMVHMLTKGGFNLSKFVKNSLEVYKPLEKDNTLAKPFSAVEITTILDIQGDLKKR